MSYYKNNQIHIYQVTNSAGDIIFEESVTEPTNKSIDIQGYHISKIDKNDELLTPNNESADDDYIVRFGKTINDSLLMLDFDPTGLELWVYVPESNFKEIKSDSLDDNIKEVCAYGPVNLINIGKIQVITKDVDTNTWIWKWIFKYNDDGTTEYLESSKDVQTFTTPEELNKWMKKKILYKSTGKLLSYDEVLKNEYGDCHDQSLFEITELRKMKIHCGRLFLLEYTKWNNPGGATHTLVYFTKNTKFYWFENAWYTEGGIHGPYNDINELKDDVAKKWKYSGINDKLFIGPCSGVTPGMDLNEYAMKCIPENEPSKIYQRKSSFNESVDDMLESVIDDFYGELFTEKCKSAVSTFFKDRIATRVDKALSDPSNVTKFNKFVGAFINRNMINLTKSGPCDMIPFTDVEHKTLFDILGFQYTIDTRPKKTSPNEILDMVNEFTKQENINLNFVKSNCSQILLFFVIRYFTIHQNQKSLNSALSIYALCVYPLMFHKYFPYGVLEPFMVYTIDTLTDKFLIKKSKHLFDALLRSIQNSYNFHKNNFKPAYDEKLISWMERIRNDQNSMFKKISNEYMKNWKAGNAARKTNEQYDTDTPIVDDVENATTMVSNVVQKVTFPIVENGVDLLRAEAAAKMGGVSVSDCRQYMTLIINDKNVEVIQKFIESVLFLYLYEEKKTERDIRSSYFLAWAGSLFKKTNSKNPNIINISNTLNNWAENTGIYEKFKREASRINYKKAIFFYFILCIQKEV